MDNRPPGARSWEALHGRPQPAWEIQRPQSSPTLEPRLPIGSELWRRT